MHQSSRHSHRNDHTIVLQSRDVRAPRPLIIGSKQEYLLTARGSPPTAPPRVPYKHSLAPPSRQKQTYTPHENYDPKGSDLLVRFGIDNYVGRMVVRVLIWVLLFQPVYVALGMELEVAPTEAVETTQSEENSTSEGNESPQSESTTVPEETETVYESTEAETDVSDESGEVVDDSTYDTETSEEESDYADTNETEGGDTSDTDSESAESGEGEVTEDVASSTEDIASSTEETASTTVESETDVESTVQNSENKYTFSEGDCTLVSEGEFYCVADGPERQVSEDPRVYSEKDREGDREIYYFDGVEIQRITNNSYDDFAPVFEEETMRIVWQAMVQDRLQIMIHDIPTNTTRQITTSRQNSSNPNIAGDTVVWQEWVDTNWEIMMTEVSAEGQPFEVERLTDNMVHDMFPVMYDDLVTWQSERGSSWEVVVYDLTTGKRHTLEKGEDTMYENPRFVLLFDSKHDNGDVETIGYDLGTGEQMELGTKSNPQPLMPVTPKEKVPEASFTSTSSTLLKEGDEGGSGDGEGDDGVI